MTMNPWIAEQLVDARLRDLRRDALRDPAASAVRARRTGRRSVAARWSGQLLIRAGARLAGLPATWALGPRPEAS